jgi:hypothetical protein
MRITRTRTLAAIATAALALTALAGCGSDDKSKDAGPKTTVSSSSSPSASSSPSDDVTGDTSPAADGEAAAPGERLTAKNLVATMLAAMREKKTAHMTMELGSSISADADVRYSSDATEMKMSMEMGPTTAQVILVDGTVYMQQSAGSKFVKISKDTPGVGDMITQLTGLSPSSSVSAMRGSLKKVQYVGRATVKGTTVDKYRVTADTAAMARTLGSTAGMGDLPKTVSYDLYVDSDHLMRRIDMKIAGQSITMLVDKWGEPVDITAPPASEVLSQ